MLMLMLMLILIPAVSQPPVQETSKCVSWMLMECLGLGELILFIIIVSHHLNLPYLTLPYLTLPRYLTSDCIDCMQAEEHGRQTDRASASNECFQGLT